MPIRNEAQYLDRSFDALDSQTYPAKQIEILVVDGGSDDGTIDVVGRRAANDSRIELLGGPGVNTPTAMNLGIDASTGIYIAKVDGHGWVNPDFISSAVKILEAQSDVGCVGGAIVPVASTPTQRAIELARFSKLGVGSGIYTAPKATHDINTVQCGVYRRSALEEAGGFDPHLQFGEDEEVNHRVRARGYRIVFEPTMRFHYHVRPTIRSLFRQYRNYGRARVAVVRKHPSFLRVKHLVPALLVMALVASLVLGVLVSPAIPLLVVGAYVVAIALGGLVLTARRPGTKPHLVSLALAALHVGYGVGTLEALGSLLRPSR
jgi:cellulose synthase/poly-beta-1,6-N-acetylglucosamine synthase-like glycosyltransferase